MPPTLLLTWATHALQVDLPTALGMDMVHCERQARLAIEESKGTLQLIQGELIMQSYFDSLAAEVQETLQVTFGSACHRTSQFFCEDYEACCIMSAYSLVKATVCRCREHVQCEHRCWGRNHCASSGGELCHVLACRSVGWSIWQLWRSNLAWQVTCCSLCSSRG